MIGFYLVCHDQTLGKVAKSTLSQQTLMELFVTCFDNPEKLWDFAENPKPFEEWKGVVLNEDGEVEVLFWGPGDLYGTIDFQWIPDTLRKLYLNQNNLDGSINLTNLPPLLMELTLNLNRFSGCVDLTALPLTMEKMDLSRNSLMGALNFTRLPMGFQEIYLNDNRFSGWTDFSKLRSSIKVIEISSTLLEGDIYRKPGLKIFARNSKVQIL